jgi:hypothetical protein
MGSRFVRAPAAGPTRTMETVSHTQIETEGRTIVVADTGPRMCGLVRHAVALARAQGHTTGIPYRQVVVFGVTDEVRGEQVGVVTGDAAWSRGAGEAVARIRADLSTLATDGAIRLVLALVPHGHPKREGLAATIEALVAFQARHGFKGHIVLIGDPPPAHVVEALQARLSDVTLVPVPDVL